MAKKKITEQSPTDDLISFIKANMDVVLKVSEHCPIKIKGNDIDYGKPDVREYTDTVIVCNICTKELDIDEPESVFEHAREHVEKKEGKFITSIAKFMDDTEIVNDEDEDSDPEGDFELEDDDEPDDDDLEELDEDEMELLADEETYEIDDDGTIICDNCLKRVNFTDTIKVHAFSTSDKEEEDCDFVFCSKECKNTFLYEGDAAYFVCDKCQRLICEISGDGKATVQFRVIGGKKVCYECGLRLC